jgi:hypothetical protein
MKVTKRVDDLSFTEVVDGLLAGDFTKLSPLFEKHRSETSAPIITWFDQGLFKSRPQALAEAFSCACFNGHLDVVEYLLSKGVDPNGGANTGMNAFHWAANRGQEQVVEMLIRDGADLERRNSYGGTILGCAVWSALHEPKPQHLTIVESLLSAGADVCAAEYPTGDQQVDTVLKRFRPAD